MGENYFKQENLDSALFFYSKGLEAQPDYALNYVGKGKVNWFKGNADVAKASFDKALELSKRKDILVLSKIAECYTQAEKKELDLALGLLTEAQKLDPKNIDVYLLTGDVYSEKQDGNKGMRQGQRKRFA
jgi:tetratricopeptide (TPR) repeat protein